MIYDIAVQMDRLMLAALCFEVMFILYIIFSWLEKKIKGKMRANRRNKSEVVKTDKLFRRAVR